MREKKFAGVANWRSRLFWEVLLAAVIFFLAIKPEEVQADLILEPEELKDWVLDDGATEYLLHKTPVLLEAHAEYEQMRLF